MNKLPAAALAGIRQECKKLAEASEPDSRDLNNDTFTKLQAQLSALNAAELKLDPGDILFWEGEHADVMYMMLEGCAGVFKGPMDAPTVLAYRCRPGDFMGDMALLEGNIRSASVVAIEPLRLMRISPDDFWSLLSMNPVISRELLNILSRRLRESDFRRKTGTEQNRQLQHEVSELSTERDRLLELEQVRQETTHLIVHDLRNPLWMIQGALDGLKQSLPEGSDNMVREMIDIALAAQGRMKNLIEVLLETARLEDGQEAFEFQTTDVNQLLDQVAERFGLFLRYQNINLDLQKADSPPAARMDKVKIERVLINLLDNAIKHTPGQGDITLASEHLGDWLRLSVIDTGPGIPDEARRRIFERYNQVGKDKLGKGYGLGLRFCKLAVEGHGGGIEVVPGPQDKGSCFRFTLPVA